MIGSCGVVGEGSKKGGAVGTTGGVMSVVGVVGAGGVTIGGVGEIPDDPERKIR